VGQNRRGKVLLKNQVRRGEGILGNGWPSSHFFKKIQKSKKPKGRVKRKIRFILANSLGTEKKRRKGDHWPIMKLGG